MHLKHALKLINNKIKQNIDNTCCC